MYDPWITQAICVTSESSIPNQCSYTHSLSVIVKDQRKLPTRLTAEGGKREEGTGTRTGESVQQWGGRRDSFRRGLPALRSCVMLR